MKAMKIIQEVNHPESANILTNIAQLRLLEPFFRAEVSLSEVAKERGMKLNTLLYQVNKFVDLGILEVAREVPRRGKATKLYRAGAKEFFIPFELTSSLSLEDFFTTTEGKIFRREVAKVLQTLAPDIGFIVSLDAQKQISLSMSSKSRQGFSEESFFGSQSPAVFLGDGLLRLDFTTAKAFQNDLLELYKRYTDKQTPDSQRYAFRLGLTPVSDDTAKK